MAKKSKEREEDELISSLVSNKRRKAKRDTTNSDVCFIGNPLSAAEARRRWPHHYQSNNMLKRVEVAGSKKEGSNSEGKEVLQVRCHYTQAKIDGGIIPKPPKDIQTLNLNTQSPPNH